MSRRVLANAELGVPWCSVLHPPGLVDCRAFWGSVVACGAVYIQGWWPVASAGEPEAPTLTFLLQIGLETDSGPGPLGRVDSKIKGVFLVHMGFEVPKVF